MAVESGDPDRRRVWVCLCWVLALVLLDLLTKAGAKTWWEELKVADELVRAQGGQRYPLLGTEWLGPTGSPGCCTRTAAPIGHPYIR